MIHPWRRLRALAHIDLLWHDEGPMGLTNFAASTISLRRDLDQAQRRSTILHECLHAERGPVPMGLVAKDEVKVRKETAHLLLPDVRAIGDALAWSQGDMGGAAAELWVDAGILRDRLGFLTDPAERGYLARRFEES